MPTGNFFAIDPSLVRRALDLGTNEGVALLVLAGFSDSSNTTTKASVHAIEQHTNIPRKKAAAIIERLIRYNIMARTESGNRPKYRFLSSENKNLVWLPNRLIWSRGQSVYSPLERLRQTQDPECLSLLLHLYSLQALAEEGGVSPQVASVTTRKERLLDRGGHTFWSFTETETSVNPTIFSDHMRAEVGGDASFWERMDRLRALRLITFVPHVFEAAALGAEWIATIVRSETEVERIVDDGIEEACSVLLPSRYGEQRAAYTVPVRMHMEPQLVGVLRLRYRAYTRATAAWHRELIVRNGAYLKDLDLTFRQLGHEGLTAHRRFLEFLAREQHQGEQHQGEQHQGEQLQGLLKESINDVSTKGGGQGHSPCRAARREESGSSAGRSPEPERPLTPDAGLAACIEPSRDCHASNRGWDSHEPRNGGR